MGMYYGSHVKIICHILTPGYIVCVGLNLVFYIIYKYLMHIKAIKSRPLLEALFSKDNTIRRCLLWISVCTYIPFEKGLIRLAAIFSYQVFIGKLDKKVLFFSGCFILFNYLMEDYYYIFLSLITIDIFAYRLYFDTLPPMDNMRAAVNIDRPNEANIATERVKRLPYHRKLQIFSEVRDILTRNPYAANKLTLLNYEQLGLLKNLCSEPSFVIGRPFRFAGDIINRTPFNRDNMGLAANTRSQGNFIHNFDGLCTQYRAANHKPF